MKRLVIVSILSVFAAASSGCLHCFQKQQVARPCAPAAAPCCSPGGNPYGGITTVPSLNMPQGGVPVQVMPGPEAYTP